MQSVIKVSFSELTLIETKMSKLNNKIQNRKLVISLTNSKGDMANAILESANQLQKLKNALCNLTSDTRKLVKNTEISFKNTDEKITKNLKK